MKRWLYWSAVLVGVLLLAGGSVLAAVGYADTAGPDGAVRGYFTALARGDAATALAYGDIPDGPHTLLTAPVLRAQQRIAPLRGFRITGVQQHGRHARVAVRYVLAYRDAPQTIRATVGVHEGGSGWRLDEVAIPTTLDLDRAIHRATIVGAGIPAGDTLLFPGAVPITFDTPYIQLDASHDSVGFDNDGSTQVYLQVSPAGRRAAVAATAAELRRCLTGAADPRCPLPTERFVPGTLRGSLDGPLDDNLTVTLDFGADGVLDIAGSQPIAATSFRRLNFSNRPVAGHGRVVVDVHARAYAVAPLHVVWLTT